MSILRETDQKTLLFFCPGCKCGHQVWVNGAKSPSGGSWNWNGSMDKPTFSPSILVFANDPARRCHSYVRDGRIQFLTDSYHELSGATVSLEEM